MERERILFFTGLTALLLISSGCVADSIEEDSVPGQVLDVFGEFKNTNNSTSYEFSLGSMTNNTLMKPVQGAVDQFKSNMSDRGVEIQSTEVEVKEVSSDKIKFDIQFDAEANNSQSMSRNVTMTLVRENGQWKLKDPFNENIDGSYYDSSSYR